ncbi:MAG TPA: NlpC/P60 family protein [Acidobacteriota bacterium]|nr:NlpC/P60 family protein [Acidobacteriota bacterium]
MINETNPGTDFSLSPCPAIETNPGTDFSLSPHPAIDLTDLINSARFVRGGRTPAALDCQGLMIEVMRRFGHAVQPCDLANYATCQVAAAVAGQAASGKWARVDAASDALPGGLVVALALDPQAPGDAQHLGVTIGGGKFIHILATRGVLVSRLDDRFFANKIRGYYRWIG